MSPVASCRLVRLVPFRAVLSGLRVVLCRPVPPKSAWFVCKKFAAKQAGRPTLPRPIRSRSTAPDDLCAGAPDARAASPCLAPCLAAICPQSEYGLALFERVAAFLRHAGKLIAGTILIDQDSQVSATVAVEVALSLGAD